MLNVEIEAAGKSVPGSVHSYQDRIFLNKRKPLFLVADGVSRSSHGDGGVAAGLILNLVEAEIEKGADLSTAVIKANSILVKRRFWDKDIGETTLTGCIIVKNIAHIINIGDSPAYLLRNLSCVTMYTEDKSPEGYITQVIGQPNISVHSAAVELHPGDRIVLMSDGINNLDTGAIMRDASIEKVVEKIISDQKDFHGYDDDKSIIVIRVL